MPVGDQRISDDPSATALSGVEVVPGLQIQGSPGTLTNVQILLSQILTYIQSELGLGTAALLDVDTDVTLAANSDTLIATQKAIKAYVDGLVAAVADVDTDEVYTSDTGSTADSDPGNGLFKWNNATQASATELYFDNQTAAAVSLTSYFASLPQVGYIHIAQNDDATKWQIWKWSVAPIAGAGYYKFTGLTLMANGGSLVDNKATSVSFKGMPQGPITTSGLTMSTAKILARLSASTGAIEETTLTALIDAFIGSTAQGDLLYRNGTIWTRLAASTAGRRLKTQGAGADPAWVDDPTVVAMFYPGVPTASALVMLFSAPAGVTTLTAAAAIAGSSGKALTAATAQTDLDVRKNATTSANGTSVGTIRFAAAGTVPTFIAASGFTLTGGTDTLSVWAPASPDATLANISASLFFTHD